MRIELGIVERAEHRRIESLKSRKTKKLAIKNLSANSHVTHNDFAFDPQKHLTDEHGIDRNEETTQHIEADKNTRRHQPLRTKQLNDEAGEQAIYQLPNLEDQFHDLIIVRACRQLEHK